MRTIVEEIIITNKIYCYVDGNFDEGTALKFEDLQTKRVFKRWHKYIKSEDMNLYGVLDSIWVSLDVSGRKTVYSVFNERFKEWVDENIVDRYEDRRLFVSPEIEGYINNDYVYYCYNDVLFNMQKEIDCPYVIEEEKTLIDAVKMNEISYNIKELKKLFVDCFDRRVISAIIALIKKPSKIDSDADFSGLERIREYSPFIPLSEDEVERAKKDKEKEEKIKEENEIKEKDRMAKENIDLDDLIRSAKKVIEEAKGRDKIKKKMEKNGPQI